MATYDFRETTVGRIKKGIFLEWESLRLVLAVVRDTEHRTNELHIRGATVDDREAVQEFINRSNTEFVVTKGQQKFMDILGAYVSAKYEVVGAKNKATFDNAAKALKFAKTNNASVSTITVYPDGIKR